MPNNILKPRLPAFANNKYIPALFLSFSPFKFFFNHFP